MILIMTRWHDDDLGGRLLKYEKDEWHVLCLPALADTSDPIGREVGEPIWPLWESKAQLTRKRDAIGSRVWAALFQQTPRPPGEGLFKINRLLLTDTVLTTDTDRVVRAWDLAATTFLGDNDPDWTVGLKLACSPSDHFTILDVVRFRGSPREVEEKITSTARADGISVWIGLPEDPGQAGKSQIAYLSGRLAGYRIMAFRETGSKLTRALPLASQIEANNFSIVRGGWNHSLLSEMADFPMSNKDDQVDALVRGFMTLVRMTGQARSVSIPYIAR
jgi:predicted phage terminase large subunit-like protein